MKYWFNVDTRTVQSDDERGQNANVLGPYDTPQEAERALEIAHEKTERWDEEDRAWEDRGASWSTDE